MSDADIQAVGIVTLLVVVCFIIYFFLVWLVTGRWK